MAASSRIRSRLGRAKPKPRMVCRIPPVRAPRPDGSPQAGPRRARQDPVGATECRTTRRRTPRTPPQHCRHRQTPHPPPSLAPLRQMMQLLLGTRQAARARQLRSLRRPIANLRSLLAAEVQAPSGAGEPAGGSASPAERPAGLAASSDRVMAAGQEGTTVSGIAPAGMGAQVPKGSRSPELIEAGMVYVDPEPEIGSAPAPPAGSSNQRRGCPTCPAAVVWTQQGPPTLAMRPPPTRRSRA